MPSEKSLNAIIAMLDHVPVPYTKSNGTCKIAYLCKNDCYALSGKSSLPKAIQVLRRKSSLVCNCEGHKVIRQTDSRPLK